MSEEETITSFEEYEQDYIKKHTTTIHGYTENYVKQLQQENKQLKEDIEELNILVGIRQKRGLISKFDKEYDEEDKKKNPSRDYAEITPDAEEVYKRYYKLKAQLKQSDKVINEIKTFLEDCGIDLTTCKECSIYDVNGIAIYGILQKYKEGEK